MSTAEGGEAGRRHLVVLPLSAYGHTIPALLLADRLLNLGYEITYICPEYRMKQLLQQSKARGCSQEIRFKTLKRTNPVAGKSELSVHDTIQILASVILDYHENSKELKEIMEELFICGGTPPSCIICDAVVSLWAQDVANEFKIPWILFFASPALALTLIPGMENSGLSLVHPDENCVPRDDLGSDAFEFFLESCLKIHDAVGVMCNTMVELEADACKALEENRLINPNNVPFAAIGPLLPRSCLEESESDQTFEENEAFEGAEKKDACLKWLDQQTEASVVYISLGSLGEASAEQVKEFAFGLEASRKGFLWVLPGDGVESLPDGFLETATGIAVNNRGFVLRTWAPQLQVLKHRATGGFLTHCGWNSTLESMSHGVPMITMPFFTEQGGNAKMIVEYFKIGVRLPKDESGVITRHTIEVAVREVIENDAMRKRAAELKQVVRATAKAPPLKTKAFLEQILNKY
ncbi:hypothetical protein SELMODRAFT_152941 [Selaginella moellendorffii]|uniref:Glycosyltransferase n=1 Tax=Selaginella moellendorffii TaxID=88036 RepID=D8S6T5_SELML|nr:hypothetical protein SELMODRAFT_152941 [Selaginella moellendorffii]